MKTDMMPLQLMRAGDKHQTVPTGFCKTLLIPLYILGKNEQDNSSRVTSGCLFCWLILVA